MIKANELRIGNLVNTPNSNMNPFKVENIESTGIDKIGGNNGLGAFVYWHFIDIEPIQLTEEWLLRLGFVLSYESEFRRKFDLDSDTKFGYDYDLNGNVNGMQGFRHYGRYYKCEDVNTLQNLYFFLSNGSELTL